MARIFFCADTKFPKGDAGANRVQYIAKALQYKGNDIYIFSVGGSDEKNCEGFHVFGGLKYKNISIQKNKILRIIDTKITHGKNVLCLLKSMRPDTDDIVIIYASNCLFVEPIVRFCNKRKIKVFVDVVEWHQPFQYKFGQFDPRYRSSNRTFTKLALLAGNVISISSLLGKYYKSKGSNTEVIPILIDSAERTGDVGLKTNDKIELIYPGNPQTKDDFKTMVLGLDLLPKDIQNKIVFHVTGAKEKTLYDLMGNDRRILEKLKCIKIHGWMNYEELVSLYKKVDYLYMSRPDNLVTRANFPSKLPELMAYGIVPIGTKVGDYYSYLEDGVNCILFEKNTPEDCAIAVKRAVSVSGDDLYNMKKAAKQCAKEKFDFRNWADIVADFILK